MDFIKVRNILFIGLLLIVTIVFLSMIKVFAYPIFWAAIIAGIFYPVYRLINKKIKIPNLSTVIVMLIIFLVIVLPLISISTLVVKESVNLYSSVSSSRGQIGETMQDVLYWVQNNPVTSNLNIDEVFWTEKFTDFANIITSFLISSITIFTQNSIVFLIMFFITFYTLFFFIRDGKKLLQKLMHLCPLGDSYEKILYQKFTSTARATIKGSLIIGLIQGILGWGMFMVAGIQGAMIWGVLMVLLSSVPGLGSYFVWLPAAIIMLIIGEVWTGLGMILFGTLVIGTIDNFLRPMLVGRDSQMHPLLVLLSTLGGIVVFGISGFVIGPIFASLMMAFWDMYEDYYRKELDHN